MCSAATHLADFPTELWLKVLDHLDDPSLCSLGMTSKYFHSMVFPYFFSKYKIINPETGSLVNISSSGSTECILRAVRCSFKAKHIVLIYIAFDGDVARLLDDIGELMAIIRQTSNIREIVLNLNKLDVWARRWDATLPEGFGPEEWVRMFGNLVGAAVGKRCPKVSFYGGATFVEFLQGHEVNSNLIQTQSLESELSSVEIASPPFGTKNPSPSQLIFQRVSRLFRREPPVPNPIVLLGGMPPLEAKLSGEQLSRSELKTVNVPSDMLLTPAITRWTTRFLHHNAHSITQLTVDSSTDGSWDKALTMLTLPNLTNFSISSYFVVGRDHVSPSILAFFLSRHSKIQQLDLQGYPNPAAPTVRLNSPILPDLTHITAHPTTLQWILRAKKSWTSLKQVQPSTIYYTRDLAFDHTLLDDVLVMLVSRKARRANFSLGFQFSVERPLNDWFQSHVDAGGRSLLTRFRGTTRLNIRSIYFVKLLCLERIEVFAQWVALFPNVEELSLQDHPAPWPMTNSQIVSYLRGWCPRVRKLVINETTIIDVATFEEPVST